VSIVDARHRHSVSRIRAVWHTNDKQSSPVLAEPKLRSAWHNHEELGCCLPRVGHKRNCRQGGE
jgi:hypothetical protein